VILPPFSLPWMRHLKKILVCSSSFKKNLRKLKFARDELSVNPILNGVTYSSKKLVHLFTMRKTTNVS
jgi:hypothetical protein